MSAECIAVKYNFQSLLVKRTRYQYLSTLHEHLKGYSLCTDMDVASAGVVYNCCMWATGPPEKPKYCNGAKFGCVDVPLSIHQIAYPLFPSARVIPKAGRS